MRDGRSLAELGAAFSWLDLRSYIRWSGAREGSVIYHVLENPPIDPSTVPTSETLASISERIAEKRAQLAGARTEVVSHNRRDRATTT